MKLSNPALFIILLIIAGIIWIVTKKKEDKKIINVRPYKKTITIKGHSRSQPKTKSKKRRSGKR
jgi:hypothetical protein